MTQTQTKLVRIVTAGSVDDGKSTLIGRILHDSQALMSDQVDALSNARFSRAEKGDLDLSFVTDGLESEREQGITIDVAYRYFATPETSFIVIDAPGHEQYTRNMVTGASNADVAIVLVDASRLHQGALKVQTRRHATIAHLLGLKVVFAVNKMDLVSWSQKVFQEAEESLKRLTRSLGIKNPAIVPINARSGDNVVTISPAAPWYQGASLLDVLQSQGEVTDLSDLPFRFPVQRVVRVDGHTLEAQRGYSGRIASGQVAVGEAVFVGPHRRPTKVSRIETYDQSLVRAEAGQSVTLYTEDEVDAARGDILTGPESSYANRVITDLCWLDDQPWDPRRRYLLQQGTAAITSRIERVLHIRDMRDLSEVRGGQALKLNDIALVQLHTQTPILADHFQDNPKTGAFILIDPETNQTAAAGMIRGVV
ncbi:GTP-binding protein [Aquidulcibacter sp.]|jgi:sulfate adenylyltransferase subunit 1|uniref:sulfate adenylyltransferase subunit 1 n=1 Tax=Aquidulcibacter sp. TaxID=2052990 RepID=UPI0028B06E34|nr:GTP-binding protein [Aquidulcibacter sp.]